SLPAVKRKPNEEASDVVDTCRDPVHSMASRDGKQLYAGRFHPHIAGARAHRVDHTAHHRKKGRKLVRDKAQSAEVDISSVRSRAIKKALKRENRSAASPHELAQQARRVAGRRSKAERRQAGRRAAGTKSKPGLKRPAKKAARTRQRAA